MKVEDLGVCVMCRRREVMVEEGGFNIKHLISYCLERVKREHSLVIAGKNHFHHDFAGFQSCLQHILLLRTLLKPA